MFRKKMTSITGSKIVSVLLVLICIALPVVSLAQGPVDPQDVPIDGGLSLLIAAGSAYGIKKYRNYKAAGKEGTAQK